MRNEEKKEILDAEGIPHSYFCMQLPATQSTPLKFELAKMLGPTLKAFKGLDLSKGIEGLDQDTVVEIFGNALGELFKDNDPSEVFAFIKKLVKQATRDKERITDLNYDQIYTGNEKEQFAACMFVLRVNFGDFFKGSKLGEKLTSAMAQI